MVKVGIAKTDLLEALKPNKPIREERIEVLSLYIADEKKQCVWTVLDYMDFNLKVVNTIKRKIGEESGISLDNIHVLTTHNHGACEPNAEILAEISSNCVLNAKENSKPAKMRYALTKLDEQVSIIRRKYVKEIDSVVSIYYGATAKDGFDASPFVENAVEKLKIGKRPFFGKMPTERAFDPFDSGDREVFVCQFASLDGEPIGTIARFASHAVCCNSPDYYSSDYPYHVRRNFEREFGGTCVFFNGPCADIAPGIENKTSGYEKTLGDLIFGFGKKAIENLEFSNIKEFSDKSVSISLKVRKGVRENKVEVKGEMPSDLIERRKYLERLAYQDTLGFLREKYAEGESQLSEKTDISLGILRIDSLTVVGFPGETFSTTAKEVKEEVKGDLVTVTEHGRTVMYIPPKLECERGGYESVCRVTKAGEEQTLKEKAILALKEF